MAKYMFTSEHSCKTSALRMFHGTFHCTFLSCSLDDFLCVIMVQWLQGEESGHNSVALIRQW